MLLRDLHSACRGRRNHGAARAAAPVALVIRGQRGGSKVPYQYLNVNKPRFRMWSCNEIEIYSNTDIEIIRSDCAYQ